MHAAEELVHADMHRGSDGAGTLIFWSFRHVIELIMSDKASRRSVYTSIYVLTDAMEEFPRLRVCEFYQSFKQTRIS